MKKFQKFLEDNLISFSVCGDCIVNIDGKTYELYIPAYDGALFDDDFNFVGMPANTKRRTETIETECDFYAYSFGGVYYYLPRGKENSAEVKLNRLKYLGKANQEIPTNVFLGVHGQYELMSGSGTYEDWVKKAKFLGVHTLGICEKNSLAGALKFQTECQKNGIKSIIGMECVVYDRPVDKRLTVKVYARNKEGWLDLLTINKFINCDFPKYIPLEDFNKITRGNDNLLMFLDPKTANYQDIKHFNIDTILFQVDPVEYVDENRDRTYLLNLKSFVSDCNLVPIPLVDAWYLDEEYSCIRQRLHSIGNTTAYESDNQYFKSNQQVFIEIASMFPEKEFETAYEFFTGQVEYLENIVEAIDFKIDVSNRHLPEYKMTPEEAKKYKTTEDLFWGLIAEGLDKHPDLIKVWGEDVVYERIDREVSTIKLGQAIDYFLITRDIIRFCHENNIMTGISRGSAGGALVSYLLGITKLDPLRYNLLFERFLNEGRVQVTLPDIDMDFPGEDRPRVKKYMEERWGINQVCSVGTYTSLQLRAAIKDLTRIYGLEFKEVNDMMKLFSVKDREPEDLFKIACVSSKVKSFVKKYSSLVNELMLIMPAPKAQSIHACAMMIFPTEHDMFHWVPIRKVGEDYVTEWEGNEMDEAGFLKEDILGVKQFDKFQDIVRLVKEHEGIDLDIFNLPLNDREVYRFFGNGWNEDNFHFGSRGLTAYCKQMKPDNIEDLIAAISLYRPGAMENNFHNEYVFRKEGKHQTEYYIGTENILNTTYGVFVYQEQIMELCRHLGGLTMVEADDVRKAMVKKKYEALQQYREKFIPYYQKVFRVSYEYSVHVWDAIDKASTYLFNRSHAAAYAITGYISQWLKVHYPIEYWSVAFKYADDKDYARYIAEINKTGMCQVRPVDINISEQDVVIDFENKELFWSITGVKQIAEKAATQILEERKENGRYWQFTDFLSRHKWKGSAVNSRVIKNLILAGAFDKIEKMESPKDRLNLLIDYYENAKIKVNEHDEILVGAEHHANQEWWWGLVQKSVSGFAIIDYKKLYEEFNGEFPFWYEYCTVEECSDVDNKPNNGYVTIGGYVTEVDIKKTKGGMICKLLLEHNYEFIEVIFFKEEYEEFKTLLSSAKDSLILINGILSYDERNDVNNLRAGIETNIVVLTL